MFFYEYLWYLLIIILTINIKNNFNQDNTLKYKFKIRYVFTHLLFVTEIFQEPIVIKYKISINTLNNLIQNYLVYILYKKYM